MATADLRFDGTFTGWKSVARDALGAGLPPENVRWLDARQTQGELGLSADAPAPSPSAPPPSFRVPREFLDLAAAVACHRDDSRWALLYRALWRLTQGETHLLDLATDGDVHALRLMAGAVGRDLHKMHAFVRFREVSTSGGPWYVAWFEPQHLIVEAAAPFFRDRFHTMRWAILTPDRCAYWDMTTLVFSPGAKREDAPAADAAENLWLAYYASIFNPARVKVAAMTAQMPRHYWKNLPEAALIPSLLAESGTRVTTMLTRTPDPAPPLRAKTRKTKGAPPEKI